MAAGRCDGAVLEAENAPAIADRRSVTRYARFLRGVKVGGRRRRAKDFGRRPNQLTTAAKFFFNVRSKNNGLA